MIVDASAIIAILLDEPEAFLLADTMASAAVVKLSTGSWVELAAVLTGRGDADLEAKLAAVMRSSAIVIVAASVDQAKLGHDAYRKFGRGSGHRARLNFGDCFAYALAKETGEPLLFKGDDFVHTDIVSALA